MFDFSYIIDHICHICDIQIVHSFISGSNRSNRSNRFNKMVQFVEPADSVDGVKLKFSSSYGNRQTTPQVSQVSQVPQVSQMSQMSQDIPSFIVSDAVPYNGYSTKCQFNNNNDNDNDDNEHMQSVSSMKDSVSYVPPRILTEIMGTPNNLEIMSANGGDIVGEYLNLQMHLIILISWDKDHLILLNMMTY